MGWILFFYWLIGWIYTAINGFLDEPNKKAFWLLAWPVHILIKIMRKLKGWKGLLESKWWMWLPFTYKFPKFEKWVMEPKDVNDKIERLAIKTSNRIISMFFTVCLFCTLLIIIF